MSSASAKPIDRFIPLFIIGFFLLLAALLGGFIWLAVHSYPGEVTANAYTKGLAYNHVIGEAGKQDALGWQGEMHFAHNGLMVETVFTLADKQNAPITDAKAVAWFIRSTLAGNDVKLPLVADGRGGYAAKTRLPLPGEWEVHVSATEKDHNFQQVKTLNLQ